MRFSFFATMHHELGQRSLEDVMGIIGKQLRALGHEAVLDPRNAKIETSFFITQPDDINIVIEGFTPAWIEVIERATKCGARFLIVATEEPTPKGFNWGRDKEMAKRQEIFPQAAKHAVGILHLVPGQHVTDWYGQFAPAAFAELGYAPSLVRPQMSQAEFEFGFYGSLTPRRKRILTHLSRMTSKEKAVKIVPDFKDQATRDKEMQRAKVILQIRKFDEMGLVSSSRCNTALNLGRPVIAEPHELSKPWDEVVDFASSMEGFYHRAITATSMWRPLWATQFERFRNKMTPEFCIGEPLRKIGLGHQPRVELTSILPKPGVAERSALRKRAMLYGESGVPTVGSISAGQYRGS